MTETQFLERDGDKPKLAYKYTAPTNKDLPTVVFLSGYISDMQGTKATNIEGKCTARGQGFLRLDYSGHGQSDGAHENGTLGEWIGDAKDVIRHATQGRPLLLVGSSMGGWVALDIALSQEFPVKGIIGIASAPDFTKWGVEETMTDAHKAQLEAADHVEMGDGFYTKALLEDARGHLILDKAHDLQMPITLFHGKKDDIVPWELTFRIKKAFPAADVKIMLIDDGDHRLSRERDLMLINRQIEKTSEALK